MMSRHVNPAVSCLAMHWAEGTLAFPNILSRGDVYFPQEYDGDYLFYIRDFHISRRHHM